MPAYLYDWGLIGPALPGLLRGLLVTLQISGIAFALAFALAVPVALMQMSRAPLLRFVGFAWVQVFRALSTYVLILFVYFGLAAALRINLDPFPAAILVLTLLQSAYIAEILRGAFGAVHAGQVEAGASLGLGQWQILRDITLPQVVRISLPMLITQMCQVIKDSSVVAVIGGADLMRATAHSVEMTGHPFEFYTVAALIYVTVVTLIAFGAKVLERHLGRHLG
jgi:His/Glu/Gln/Arg/opine family amino acid ABC transporter permease subunit